jgi:hypothetical protein
VQFGEASNQRQPDADPGGVAGMLRSLAKRLEQGRPRRLEVRLIGSQGSRSYTFDILGGDCRVAPGSSEERNLEVVVSEETWVD